MSSYAVDENGVIIATAPSIAVVGNADDLEDEILSANDKLHAAYSSFNQAGQGYTSPSYNLGAIASPIIDAALNTPLPPTAPTGNNLLDTLKKNTDTVSKSVNDIASVLSQTNVINARSVQSIENMGNNITMAIGAITQILGMGNQLKSISNIISNTHGNVQTSKNLKQIDDLDFKAQGRPTLVDSQGNQIVPREAQATHNAEKALETKVGNSVNWGNVMDSVTNANNEINDEGINLFEQLVNIHKLDDTTMKKIDDEIKKINWGDSNG